MATATKAANKATADAFDPRIDVYINKAAPFAQPILNTLREAIHKNAPGVVEDVKWSRPFFTIHGQNLCYLAAFKQHCAMGFWSPKMVEVLRADGIEGTESAGSFGRITSPQDLPSAKALAGYIRHAAQLAAAGDAGSAMNGREDTTRKAPLPMPQEFATALAASKAAQLNFDAFPPSCRREYIEWITTAKKQETRERRIATAVAMIGENRRFNDAYRSK